MKNSELLEKISEKTGVPVEVVKAVITECTDVIVETISSGDSVVITRFGRYYPMRETRGANLAEKEWKEPAGDTGIKLRFRASDKAQRRVVSLAEEKGTSL